MAAINATYKKPSTKDRAYTHNKPRLLFFLPFHQYSSSSSGSRLNLNDKIPSYLFEEEEMDDDDEELKEEKPVLSCLQRPKNKKAFYSYIVSSSCMLPFE